MQKLKYNFFTANEIKPEGWLRRQLTIQADSLSGNLDLIWPDVRDSSWIGGSRDGWERTPYWLDGFIPLAWLLGDENLKARAKRYVDGILSFQKPDGWLTPCADGERDSYDMWAYILVCKVLALYGDCTGDERIVPALEKAFTAFHERIKRAPLHNWGKFRWFEALIPIFWLYDKTGKDNFSPLVADIIAQGESYPGLYENWQGAEPKREWTLETHVVNAAMAIKCDALASRLSGGDPDAFAEKMYSMIRAAHGTPNGHFTGDECFAGTSPIQGSELCGVVEAMYSYEQLISLTGNMKWADRLEDAAFNALPAPFLPDMWTHQYDQQINQIGCYNMGEKRVWLTNPPDSNRFGLEPCYGCCTANFNQGWPKLALSSFYRADDGILSAVFVPSTVKTKISGADVSVRLATEYPFRDSLLYIVNTNEPVEFALHIRIPSYADAVTVDGETVAPGTLHTVRRKWKDGDTVQVSLTLTPRFVERPNGLWCVRRGAILFSLPVKDKRRMFEYEKDGVARKFPYCDYELYPDSEWQYAFASDKLETVECDDCDGFPFSDTHQPLKIKAEFVPIDWGMEEGFEFVCAAKPRSEKPAGKPVTLLLQPYGSTNLRMTEMPRVAPVQP